MAQIRNVASFILLLLGFYSATAQPSMQKVDSIIHLITPETYRQHFDSLRTTAGSYRKVVEGSYQWADHDACRDYIYRSLIGYLGCANVYLHTFDQDNYRGLANVIGIKRGNNPQKGVIIVSAHYDTNNVREENRTDCSPGANDNGTGVAAVLEIARVLSTIDIDCSVLFAAWDFEEQFTNGYPTGSNRWYTDFVKKGKKKTEKKNTDKKIDRDDIMANINFDMFGNPGNTIDGKPLLWACSANITHRKFIDDYVATFERYIPTIKTINKGMMTYSDHFTFGARKIPAVENLESDYDSDPLYHTCSDILENPDNIDIEFATWVTQGGFAFLLEKVLSSPRPRVNLPIIQDLVIINELGDAYSLKLPSSDITVTITDDHGNNVQLFPEGSKYTFYPHATGLYRISVFNSKISGSKTYLLQKKEGRPVPFL
jgi:hypothetical protein